MNAQTIARKNLLRFASDIAAALAIVPSIGFSTSTAAAMIPAQEMTQSLDSNNQNAIIAQQAEEFVNAERTKAGLHTLKHSNKLQVIAQTYAERMANEGFFSHDDPQGKRITDRINATGYHWTMIGENLAWVKTAEGNEAAFATTGWMNSPTHRANILQRGYLYGAIGVAKASDGKFYLVQIFSRPN